MKILFTAAEAEPFIKSGGLGDVAGALPQSLNALGEDCRVILPYYSDIPDAYKRTMTYIGNCFVPLSWRNVYCGIFSQTIKGVKYYFIDNEYYFKRQGLYGHYDDAERFAFFSKAVLEALPLINFIPDVIHANDWHTALIPVYLDSFYRNDKRMKNIRTVFTIHNIEFQGKYGREIADDVLGLPPAKISFIEYDKCVNFMKGAIEASSVVTTVSESYADEILDPYFAYGLDNILAPRKSKLKGVVNGIDTALFNPKKDKALFAKYDAVSYEAGKKENKKALCDMLNIQYNENIPLVGMVTRLTEQKGIDLVVRVMDKLLDIPVKLVLLGTGDWKYETILKEAEKRNPAKLKVIIGFSGDMANKIYAASDIFLMPSKFEPCGLSQLIAMRYGTIPTVRETGGLRDTVKPYNQEKKTGNGFTFYSFNAHDMLDAVTRAAGLFKDKEKWNMLIEHNMKQDYSWEKAAKQYMEIYKSI